MNGGDRPETGSQPLASGTAGSPGAGGNGAQEGDVGGTPSAPPAISLPKGGGAIRGMGEKFAANPVTGTGSMTVPIAVSPGRSGFGPELNLSYDSGAGNGPFGFGWSLSIPSITRKTNKGLPQYRDAEESDVYILSGAEDLVPVLASEGSRLEETATLDGEAYTVHRYRPRIEGLFARIERWTRQADGDVHWRSISPDNILTIYGKDLDSRIADPTDPGRIFSWLMCETRDDKGNGVLYEYKPEDGAGVDPTQAHERNRGDHDDARRTANRYLKRIHYGNRKTLLDGEGHRPLVLTEDQVENANWMFEVVFDYGEHDADTPEPEDAGQWKFRDDPFSSYRAGFEVRTCRLCQRVLMFHHIPDDPEGLTGYEGLVRSTDFNYSYEQDPTDVRNPVYTFLLSVIQSGYKRDGSGYLKRNMPPVEFEYTEPTVQDTVEEVDAESLENLPVGLDGAAYQWTDLHGEGIPGILTEQAGGWFYKRNLSPINEMIDNGTARTEAKFAPVELVATKPNLALAGGAQFMDLAGDGQPDLVVMDGPRPGLYEHDGDEGWQSFRPFTSRLNRDTRDPNLKLVDLDGDGHADILITEDDAFVWHPSREEEGFGPARRVAQALDEERGPRLVFADGTQSIYLADLSGDGLTDLARIRNGEVCYWPNLGYGRFGDKVTMDQAPHFDYPDQFDHKRIRLADINGSGTTDVIYLHGDGVRLYFNQSGNSWSAPQVMNVFPRVDDLTSITAVDLLGNGTGCLVWSSPMPDDTGRQMRYVNLMGGQKPHLLVKTVNNLGAETRVHYAPSTKFYLQDKRDGKPWITRLPFPVHVVERVETYDYISRNRFATRYAYHHGYFDGAEREFRGFGMVEQFDTEEFALLGAGGLSDATNLDAASHVPPVNTRTWFHTGAYLGRHQLSRQYASEYYGAPTPDELDYEDKLTAYIAAELLPDTVLPTGLTLEEEHEACRALKGAMLRQEVYALDGTDREPHPYTVTEQNFSVRHVQAQDGNRHAVFFTHPRETITYHYERNPADPRVQHALTLEVDEFGNVLKEAAIGYGRRFDASDDALLPEDREKQRLIHITCTENTFTHPIVDRADDYRLPLPVASRTYELRKAEQEKSSSGPTILYQFDDVLRHVNQAGDGDHDIAYEDLQFTKAKQTVADDEEGRHRYFRRLIEHVRTLYRKDDLSALLPLGEVEPLALPGESYKLAFTPGLLVQVFRRNGQPLLPDPADVLGGPGADRGGYVVSQDLKAAGGFPGTDPDDHWWMPSGRVFLSPGSEDPPAQELAFARQHFFLPHRTRDPFHTDAVSTESFVTYDAHDLLMVETRDVLGNRATVGERLPDGDLDPSKPGNDYRVLQPRLVMDPNRNRTQVAFDILGMVAGTTVMGKPAPAPGEGDSLVGFDEDLAQARIDGFYDVEDPSVPAPDLLQDATTRIIYDLNRFLRTQQEHPDDPSKWLPVCAATLARETHGTDSLPPGGLKIQISFSYSDGFGREIQQKTQAEPGPLVDGGPVVSPRWVGSGWTVFNNKGKPVRQYEPFFTDTHEFEFDVRIGVSPILLYDPAERMVATLHPNHTYEKVLFDPWQQTTYDVNDNAASDPATDAVVKGFLLNTDDTPRIPATEYAPTWHQLRTDPTHAVEFAAQYPDATDRSNETSAAGKAVAHADTPTTAYFDTLGRPFLTVAHNKVAAPNHELDGTEDEFHTRVDLDIEGNQRVVRDAIEQKDDGQGRVVMRYDYDMLGGLVHQASMEAGESWTLNDVTGNPIRAWDSRGHIFRTEYDPLRRPLRYFVTGADPANPDEPFLTERLVYGEQHPEAEQRNLRGVPYLHLDQAGAVNTENLDFKGISLRASRRIATKYKQAIDWSAVDTVLPANALDELDPAALEAALVPFLETDTYESSTTYDALNRAVMLTTPHTPAMQPCVIRPGYNEMALLERVEANLRGEADTTGEPIFTPFVTNIDYDAKGQRRRIDYGNGVSTRYDYDPLTFRLTRLITQRGAEALQNLAYTYDPVGNITHIRDDAQQTIFFKNKRVEPSAAYTYDALYRLIEATGREHLGQMGGAPIPHSHNDVPRVGLQSGNVPGQFGPNDGDAMGTYVERYVYDAVGNFLKMPHRGSDPVHAGWTRSYAYRETSLTEDGTGGSTLKTSNRLSSTTVGNGNPITERYVHDTHGNMTRMPHLGGAHPDANMHWGYRDQLRKVDLGGGGTAYYVYDAGGQRVRKVIERQNGNRQMDWLYLGGLQVYREYNSNGSTVTLERETLHIMDDQRRIALVETRTADTAGTDTALQQLIRYQFGNQVGSASLELDDQAQIISYEEYTPYGSTSYQAGRSETEVKRKRYRYTGMERDEESGLSYHSARYYAPWLARWTSADSIGIGDGMNLFRYANGNPVKLIDYNGTDSRLNSVTQCTESNLDGLTVKSLFEITDEEKAKNFAAYIEKYPLYDPDDTARIGADGRQYTRNKVVAAGKRHANRHTKKLLQTSYVAATVVAGPALAAVETGVYIAEAISGVDLPNPSDAFTGNTDGYFEDLSGTERFSAIISAAIGGASVVNGIPSNSAVGELTTEIPGVAAAKTTRTAAKPTILSDTDLLINAEKGSANSKAAIRNADTVIAPGNRSEFLNAVDQTQRTAREAFLAREGIATIVPQKWMLTNAGPEVWNIIDTTIAGGHGPVDAIFAAVSEVTGIAARTGEKRLPNFFNNTWGGRLGVNIRQVKR